MHQPRSFARDSCSRCSTKARHSFSSDRKSDCSSRSGACFWSACVCLSAGRSRGSGTDSAAAMIATSSRQLLVRARQQHAAEPRVERQPREPPADLGQLAVVRQRAELAQRALAVADIAAVGRLDEREGLDVAELQRMHLQDHGREVGALDLRLGELGPRREVLFRSRAGSRCPARRGRSGRSAGSPRPARSSRWAAAAGGCDGCSG